MGWLGSFFGSHEQVAPSKEATMLDAVMYTASLVSNPVAIDSILDTVRNITSRRDANKPLTPSDETALRNVYQKIEAYLTEKDPIRTFTQEEIRTRVSAKFPTAVAKIMEENSPTAATKNKA